MAIGKDPQINQREHQIRQNASDYIAEQLNKDTFPPEDKKMWSDIREILDGRAQAVLDPKATTFGEGLNGQAPKIDKFHPDYKYFKAGAVLAQVAQGTVYFGTEGYRELKANPGKDRFIERIAGDDKSLGAFVGAALKGQSPEIKLALSPEETQDKKTIEDAIPKFVKAFQAGNYAEAKKGVLNLARSNLKTAHLEYKYLIYPGNVPDAMNFFGSYNWHGADSIELSDFLLPENVPDADRRILDREAALVFLEEVLHHLQRLNGGNISGQDFSKFEDPHEMDVAAFMMQQGINLNGTYFVKRYGRDKI